MTENNLKRVHYENLILNSNPWFSAVSDYSLQIALFLNKKNTLLFCAEVNSTVMDIKCKENNIPFKNVPIHNQGNVFKFLRSFFFIFFFMLRFRKSLKYIWVFEGREHSLCVMTKILFPFLWKNKLLIRIRGQAQNVEDNIFSKLVYNKFTDKVICAAKCVKNRIKFDIQPEKIFLQYYCKNPPFKKNNISNFVFNEKLPPLTLDHLIFLVIGRFDPIKGHEYLIDSYLKSNILNIHGQPIKSQLVFIGYDANLKSQTIYQNYSKNFGEGYALKNMYYLTTRDNNKNLYIINSRIDDLSSIIKMAHFGIVPSLDSEVICRVGVEFLQCGTPVLFSNVGALPEVFQHFPSLSFEAGNRDSLKNKIEQAAQIFSNTDSYLTLRVQAEKIGLDEFSAENFTNLIKFLH